MEVYIIFLCLATVTYSYHSHLHPTKEELGTDLSEKFFDEPATGAYSYPIFHNYYALRKVPNGKGSQISVIPVTFSTMQLPKQVRDVDNIHLEYPSTNLDLELSPYISNGQGFEVITIPQLLADTEYTDNEYSITNPSTIYNLNGLKYIPILIPQYRRDILQTGTATQNGHGQDDTSAHNEAQEDVLEHSLPGHHLEDGKSLATVGTKTILQHETVGLEQSQPQADHKCLKEKFIIQPDLFQAALEKILAANGPQDTLDTTTVTDKESHEVAGSDRHNLKDSDTPEHTLFPDIPQNHEQIATDGIETTSEFTPATKIEPRGGIVLNEYYPYLYQLPRGKYALANDLMRNSFYKHFGAKYGTNEENIPVPVPDRYRHHGYPRGKYVREEYRPHDHFYRGNQFSSENDPYQGTFKRRFGSDMEHRFIRSNGYNGNYIQPNSLGNNLNVEPKLTQRLNVGVEGSESKIYVVDSAPKTNTEDNVPKVDNEDSALEIGAEDSTLRTEDNGPENTDIINSQVDTLTTESVPIINVHNIESINFDLEPVQVEDSSGHV